MSKLTLRLSEHKPRRKHLLALGLAVALLAVVGAGWGVFEAFQPGSSVASCSDDNC